MPNRILFPPLRRGDAPLTQAILTSALSILKIFSHGLDSSRAETRTEQSPETGGLLRRRRINHFHRRIRFHSSIFAHGGCLRSAGVALPIAHTLFVPYGPHKGNAHAKRGALPHRGVLLHKLSRWVNSLRQSLSGKSTSRHRRRRNNGWAHLLRGPLFPDHPVAGSRSPVLDCMYDAFCKAHGCRIKAITRGDGRIQP